MANLEDTITSIKGKLPNVTPTPPGFHAQATASELKSRLNWGEPGLTILDVRDRVAFNQYRIMGAMSMPIDMLVDGALASLASNRDIYVYGASDEETATAANKLREAGFQKVAELKGGVAAFKAIDGSVEGTQNEPPSPGAYNVGSRLGEFSKEKTKN